jgi:Kef-type K+ transport system membrane component KefB
VPSLRARFGSTERSSGALAILRNTRGLTELIVLNIGRDAGIISPELYAIFFAMAILTTAASGLTIKLYASPSPLLRRAARRARPTPSAALQA